MKRRKFLGLFGATAATPFLPAPAIATAAKAATGYSPAAVHAAIMHAQTRAVFSVWGLAKALNVPAGQAEALMGDLAKRGILGPLQGTTFGGRWASSKIMTHEAVVARMAARKASYTNNQFARTAPQTTDLSALMAHLRHLADTYFTNKGAVA